MTNAKILFPERLVAARKRLQWSQSDLATRTGFQPSAISHFETGARSPSLENLIRLSDELRVSTDWLVGRMLSDDAMYLTAKSIMQSLASMPESDREAITLMARLLAEKRTNKPWSCEADRSGAGGNTPQDCDWPACGCDPYADKVIAALQEEGKILS